MVGRRGLRPHEPIRHLLHRDSFRLVVWEQARGVMCLHSGRQWLRWSA
jgi:hypothetical protein